VTGRLSYLQDYANTEKDAKKLLRRLVVEADQERAASAKASLGYLLDRWLPQHELNESARKTYESLIRNHIRPALGATPLARLTRHAGRLDERWFRHVFNLRQTVGRYRGPIDTTMDAVPATARSSIPL